MEARRRSLQKRRIQSDYISKASPLKISFTPSVSECSTPSPEYHNDTPTPGTDQLEPPELARRHDSDTNEIYPSASRDTLDSFLNVDSIAQPFFMTPLPPSPHRQGSINSFNAGSDHAPGRHTELQSVDNEMDMSLTSSRNNASSVGDLTPPPSLDRGQSQKSAFVRAGEIYESFQIGMETPETPADLPIRPIVTSTDTQKFKRRKMSMSNLQSISEPPITPSLNLADDNVSTMLSSQGNEGTGEPESMNELEDDLANTSLIEDTQPGKIMQLDHITTGPEASLPAQETGQIETVHESTSASINVDRPSFSQPITRRNYTRSTARDEPPAVNEMTVVASVVGEVLLETMKSTASDSEAKAAVKLFKKQAETIFIEQMNLWNENEALQKDRRTEVSQGKKLRAKLLEIRTRRQTLHAEMEHERSLYESVEYDNKESQGLEDLLQGLQDLKAKAKSSKPEINVTTDKHRTTLQGVVKSLTARCGVINDNGHRQGGLLQLLRDFNEKLELWNDHLGDERECA
ncbi:hypothetical protein K450DRAFT_298233 [Umbelopsis ramanniana AG]|uniref:Inner kinetochore subunit AME1 domain-containing protein n=1 Tax=Umbelopsis ramanniana AG TaxID=1314678 RepID=A0AAD5HH66_UMBRA|nr:uncharacterized protein K450DRAFT_298233 [Umbelopsis ramanniana AG]KAI8581868.1 hypothetical protein K450DRAFT_298233 [Umbelopsis ramanniana AG]